MTILTAIQGTSADLLPQAMELYVTDGSMVADVTYGKGVFWRNLEEEKYQLLKSDLATGVDFRHLPWPDDFFDALILDPPFMHGGETIKESIRACYRNSKEQRSHESIIRLYGGGILEAARVLKKGGVILVKCQDETESGQQRFSHVEVGSLLELFGFQIVDLFVLVQASIPAMREKYQKSARKNHSYLLVGKFRR